MNSLLLLILALAGYWLAYRCYGRFIGRRIFALTVGNKMPAHQFRDGIDFVPSKKHVVFGHHFTTIAGLGPIVGPAIGIIWGWLPALVWVVFGSIFMGAVHDFSAMVISARNDGKTIGDLTGEIISPSTRLAFLVIIQFLLWLVLSIFAMIMGILFELYPAVVLPVWLQIPIAIGLGRCLRRGGNELLYSLGALALMYLSILVGQHFPITMPALLGSPATTWAILLFIYVSIASTLPIDILLQPRDYINAQQLLATTGLLLLGVLFAHPTFSAPALNPAAFSTGSDIPPLFPLIFITIACGAISGFHSLAASGTSVKQIDREPDMLPIGFGSMLLEGLLAIVALIAIAGGLGLGLEKNGQMFFGAEAYQVHYASWAGAQGLAAKIEAFVVGAANLMAGFGLPPHLGRALMAVFIVSFAGTTLDSATRIQRLSLQEMCKNREGLVARPFNNRCIATLTVVALAALLTFIKPGAKGALILWPLFGALNQLLAALGLTVATVYLAKRGRNYLVTAVPMLFMLVVTIWAMGANLLKFLAKGDTLLVALSAGIFALTGWLLFGAAGALRKAFHDGATISPEEAGRDRISSELSTK